MNCQASVARIAHLIDTHITSADATAIETVTGVPVSALKNMLMNAPNVTVVSTRRTFPTTT